MIGSSLESVLFASKNNCTLILNKISPPEIYEAQDLETWNQPIPVERFMDKVNQQYARMTVYNTVKEMGFQVEEEWEMEDNSIELTVTRWVQ